MSNLMNISKLVKNMLLYTGTLGPVDTTTMS